MAAERWKDGDPTRWLVWKYKGECYEVFARPTFGKEQWKLLKFDGEGESKQEALIDFVQWCHAHGVKRLIVSKHEHQVHDYFLNLCGGKKLETGDV